MTDSPLFKRAYVRGLNAELIRAGVAQYPSKEAADYAADYVADTCDMADPYTEPTHVTKEASLILCENLVKAGAYLCEEAGGVYQPDLTKTAQATDPVDLANSDAWAVLEKCAAETGSLMEGGDNPNDLPADAGTNAEAALEQARRPENYANLGEDGVGGYERKGQGSVGTEEAHPEKPKATEEGSNSAIENTSKHSSWLRRKLGMDMPPPPPGAGGGMEMAPPGAGGGMEMPPGAVEGAGAPGAPEVSEDLLKGVELGVQLAAKDPEAAAEILQASEGGMEGEAPPGMEGAGGPPPPPAMAVPSGEEGKVASLASIVRKIASGSTGALIDGGDVPNDQPAAAAGNAEAALEAARRPENYANKGEDGVGRSDMVPSKDENVGREKKHPEAPKATDSGATNVPLEHVKGAFDQLFESTAHNLVPYLPEQMADNQKVAHVRAAMGLSATDQADYLENLYVTLGTAKTAAHGVKAHFLKQAKEEKCSMCDKPKTDCGCDDHMRVGREESLTEKKEGSDRSLGALRGAIQRLHKAS